MARLRHENVVQYVTSWVECSSLPFYDRYDPGSSVSSSYTTSSSIRSGCPGTRTTRSSFQFDAAESFRDFHSFPASVNGHEIILPLSEAHHRLQSFIPPRVLFIQLELCQYNLAQWIGERNQRLFITPRVPVSAQNSSDVLLNYIVPHASARWISDQIARAVTYLHSMKVMHRDLKPENVLLCGPPLHTLSDAPCDCRPSAMRTPIPRKNPGDLATEFNCYHQLVVKLCDFGLARILQRPLCYNQAPNFIPNQFYSSLCLPEPRTTQSSRVLDSRGPHKHSAEASELTTTQQEDGLLTANLGSEIYTAPEILIHSFRNGASPRVPYDYKADMFSMAVIFLQLFHPMQTLHELIECLQHFAKSEESSRNFPASSLALPREFVICWPGESVLVAQMLSTQPALRPSALSVLRALAANSELIDLAANEDESSVSSTTENNSNEMITHRISSGHRMVDLLLWRNRQLQQELEAALQRLSTYEALQN